MKQLLFFIIILFLPILYLSGCSNDYNKESLVIKKLSTDNIDRIVFNKCTGKEKIITRNEDISEIISYINSIEYKKARKDNLSGWDYYLKIVNKDNSFTEIKFEVNKINYNDTWYKGNAYITNHLDKLYKNLNYPETQSTLKK